MSWPQQDTNRLQNVLQLVETVSALGLGEKLGLDKLTPSDSLEFRRVLRYDVQRRVGLADMFCSLPGRQVGQGVLRICAGLNHTVDRFVEYRYAARRASPQHLKACRATHERFAMLMLLPALESHQGERRDAVVRDLAALLDGNAHAVAADAMAAGAVLAARVIGGRTAAEAVGAALQREGVGDVAGARRLFVGAAEMDAADADTTVAAHLGIGRTAFHRGAYPQAATAFEMALSISVREGLSDRAGSAAHWLMALATRRKDSSAVARYTRLAVSSYGHGHPKLVALGNDLAAHLNFTGQYSDALVVLDGIRRLPADLTTSLAIQVNTALASAHLRRPESYQSAMQAAESILQHDPDIRGGPQALSELASAAAAAGEWQSAEKLARRALSLARTRGEAEFVAEAESILLHLRTRRTAPVSWNADLDLADSVAAVLAGLSG